MRLRVSTILVTALLCLAPTAGWADLAPYSQDFEGLVPAPQPEDPFESSLADDGWLFFANGFDANWNYLFGYGPFAAPNHGEAISAVVAGQGGPAQGEQQLDVFSNYRDGVHGLCTPIDDPTSPTCIFLETNVFQEQTIGAADLDTTWRFQFDAKRGNIGGVTSARAFFKVINPFAGFSLTEFIWIDMTNVPAEWTGYSLSIYIPPDWAGQILQFGFLNTATAYQGSGIFYDNVAFGTQPLGVGLDIKPGSCPNPINRRSRGVLTAALLGTGEFDVNDIDVASLQLEGVAPFQWRYDDVSEPYGNDLCGCTTAGPDGFDDLKLKFDIQDLIEVIGASPNGDLLLTLTGALLDGTPIEGLDCVVLVGGGGHRLMYPLDNQTGGAGIVDFQLNATDDSDAESSESPTRGLRDPASRRSRSRAE